jgi:uncharacterized protein with GYD domain
MATFVILIKLTDQGAASIKDAPERIIVSALGLAFTSAGVLVARAGQDAPRCSRSAGGPNAA